MKIRRKILSAVTAAACTLSIICGNVPFALAEETDTLLGDVNYDGKVSILDVVAIGRGCVEHSGIPMNADFNQNGIVDICDASAIADAVSATGGCANRDLSGDPSVSIGSAECGPGETVTLEVSYTSECFADAAVVAIDYDSSLTLTDVSGALCYNNEGNELYVACVNTAGFGDSLFTMTFETPEDAANGDCYDIAIYDLTLGNANGEKYEYPAASGGRIYIQDETDTPDTPEKTINGLTYQSVDEDEDGTDDYIEITACDESLTEVEIPEEIDGLPVTNIGDCAFYNCTSLESITIPDSVTSIESGAFCGCTSLTSITIPESVTDIGDSVFEYCTSLESIKIPDSVTSIG
ncbi:leucine-rich repeat protein, partial [Porcipelethomonas sp.]|uniref:leucine-rich repeat protein n=1 Tax=Porcipelethomonas sp. TaxID=2981675 RepID=UPI003EF2468C